MSTRSSRSRAKRPAQDPSPVPTRAVRQRRLSARAPKRQTIQSDDDEDGQDSDDRLVDEEDDEDDDDDDDDDIHLEDDDLEDEDEDIKKHTQTSTRSRASSRGRPRSQPTSRTRAAQRSSAARQRSNQDSEEEPTSDVSKKSRRSRPAEVSESDEQDSGEDGDTLEIDGQEYRIADDQLTLSTDPDGDKKIDASGRLQGGRSFRVPTFTLPNCSDPHRLYMMSIDVARALGFRDSAYFFRKHPLLHKIGVNSELKEALAEDARIAAQVRMRNATIVTARSVFQLVGARIITKGRMVLDDYYEADARKEGHREGALVSMPSIEWILRAERRRESDRERDKGRRRPDAATYTTIDPQGESVLTTFGDAGHSPFERAGQWIQRRQALQRADLTEENWMLEYARGVASLNADLAESRRERKTALPNSGVRTPSLVSLQDNAAMQEDPEEHLLSDMRPPWEQSKDSSDPASRAALQAAARLRKYRARREAEPPVGVFEPHTYRMQVAQDTQPMHASWTKLNDKPQLSSATNSNASLAQFAMVETCLVFKAHANKPPIKMGDIPQSHRKSTDIPPPK
ncbi:chromatin structure-remodeling complex subunit RSC7 [Malassezia psittaci]|uniref:Chromatin structure-remodeling complex subunit RSC7 n=1 Tax=Malassezia psittaci TaxID=1821823 RepID=A0AAF0F6K5_9BASI|nr:chromatin structure-remodeling complex subunit RSC7 [Malassezia psittaci]